MLIGDVPHRPALENMAFAALQAPSKCRRGHFSDRSASQLVLTGGLVGSADATPEANTAFSHAWHALQKALAEEPENSAAEEGAESESAAAEPAPGAASRNELNPPPEAPLSAAATKTSGVSNTTVSAPVSRPEGGPLRAAPAEPVNGLADAPAPKAAQSAALAAPGRRQIPPG